MAGHPIDYYVYGGAWGTEEGRKIFSEEQMIDRWLKDRSRPGRGRGGDGDHPRMLTSLEVPGNGVVTRELVVRGVAASSGGVPASLAPGSYRAYAVLGAIRPDLELRSPTVLFEVR